MQLLSIVMFKNLLRLAGIKQFPVLIYLLNFSRVAYGFSLLDFHKTKIFTSAFFLKSLRRKNLKSIDIKIKIVKIVRLCFF
jgi:hypothetical protein